MRTRSLLPLAALAVLASATPGCGPTPPPPAPPPPPTWPHYEPGATAPKAPDPEPIQYPHVGRTYDDALAIPEDLDAVASEPELSDSDLAAPLNDPAFLTSCGVVESTVVVVKVAVRGGKALGVTVATSPPSASLSSCLDKAVRQLTWPPSAKRFSFKTRF
ncbi:MAG TPA: hypothetical protein PLR99_23095 [Polyangiaceae bacterium]|nr:hypothetical protein [Polyangiaceae bacterium]